MGRPRVLRPQLRRDSLDGTVRKRTPSILWAVPTIVGLACHSVSDRQREDTALAESVTQLGEERVAIPAAAETQCSPAAVALLDTVISAGLNGAYTFSTPMPDYASGVDTLGFLRSGLRLPQWYVSDVVTQCITASALRARFELNWRAAARITLPVATPGYALARVSETLTDTVTASFRWLVGNLNFLIAKTMQPNAWASLAEPDRRFLDSVVVRGGDDPVSARGGVACPEGATAVLDEALDAALLRGYLRDAPGFVRTEAGGDHTWVVASVEVRCLAGSASTAEFEVAQATVGRILPTVELERIDRTFTDTVRLSQRWVIDDLRPFAKVGATKVRELPLNLQSRALLDSLAAAQLRQ